jgi:hypothetical protein
MANEINQQYAEEEARGYREKLSKVRFKQSLVQGFTGPTIFGLMAAAGTALLGAAQTGAIWAVVSVCGVAAMAVIGLYAVSQLSAEVTSIEHDYQAKQIAKGINGKVPELETQKAMTLPSQDKASSLAMPSTTVQNITHDARLIDPAQKARA